MKFIIAIFLVITMVQCFLKGSWIVGIILMFVIGGVLGSGE